MFTLDRDDLSADTLCLRLTEANDLLVAVQDTLVEHQVQAVVATQTACRCQALKMTMMPSLSMQT